MLIYLLGLIVILLFIITYLSILYFISGTLLDLSLVNYFIIIHLT
jgi:hypothetical protein